MGYNPNQKYFYVECGDFSVDGKEIADNLDKLKNLGFLVDINVIDTEKIQKNVSHKKNVIGTGGGDLPEAGKLIVYIENLISDPIVNILISSIVSFFVERYLSKHIKQKTFEQTPKGNGNIVISHDKNKNELIISGPVDDNAKEIAEKFMETLSK